MSAYVLVHGGVHAAWCWETVIGPLTDPTDPKVTHEIKEVDGALWAEARAGDTVVRSLIEYAFGCAFHDEQISGIARILGRMNR